MKENRKKILIITIAIFIVLVGIFVNFKAGSEIQENQIVDNPRINEVVNTDPEALVLQQSLDSDIILGDNNAPVTIVEYASLSCPHCANFYKSSFDELKSQYIDTKKVQFIYRDFPLNQPALAGAVIALCYANDNNRSADKYYSFIKALYKTQESWAFSEQFIEKLRSIAKLSGMNSERFDQCLDNQELQESVLKMRLDASKSLEIKSTPTFIINGIQISGFKNLEEIKQVVDQQLSK